MKKTTATDGRRRQQQQQTRFDFWHTSIWNSVSLYI